MPFVNAKLRFGYALMKIIPPSWAVQIGKRPEFHIENLLAYGFPPSRNHDARDSRDSSLTIEQAINSHLASPGDINSPAGNNRSGKANGGRALIATTSL